MTKNLFLQGDIGCGKSTLIRQNLLPFLSRVGGFFVQRILIGEQTVAFRLLPVGKANLYRLTCPATDLERMDNLFLFGDSSDRWQQDLTVFEHYGTAILKQSQVQNKRLILMDELGGVELGCSAFMETVVALLDGDVPVLGVFKSQRNLSILKKSLEAKDKIDNYRYYYERICSGPRTEFLNLTEPCREAIAARVKFFVEAACR